MAYQIVAVNDASPGACVDVGLTWNGSTTLTSTRAFSGTSITLTGGITGGASSDITLNTDKFTVDATNGNTLIAGTLEVTGATTQTGKLTCSTIEVTSTATFDGDVVLGGESHAATDGSIVISSEGIYDGYTTNSIWDITATLADGVGAGQIKAIKLETKDTNDLIVTPINFADGTTITFDATGEVALLMWDGSAWRVIYTNATVA